MEPAWLASASIGRMRVMRRPSVRTMGQPPNAVPAVSATLQVSSTPVSYTHLTLPTILRV